MSADIRQESIDMINLLHNKFENFELKVIMMDETIFSNPTNGKTVKTWKGSYIIYYRFFFEKLLPEVDRIILLDIDTIIYNELQSVFNADLGQTLGSDGAVRQNLIAGVKTVSTPVFYFVNTYDSTVKEYYSEMFSTDEAINAGFILLDLGGMREVNLGTDTLMKTREVWSDKIISPEQDVFNIAFKNRIKFLPRTYNFIYSAKLEPSLTRNYLQKQHVVHGFEPKPWDSWTFDLLHKDYTTQMRGTARIISNKRLNLHQTERVLGYKLPLFQLPVAARKSWCLYARLANMARLLPAPIYRWLFMREFRKLGVPEKLDDFLGTKDSREGIFQ
jgi:lipopolysaccharide biosynthesis glycosyltransferase